MVNEFFIRAFIFLQLKIYGDERFHLPLIYGRWHEPKQPVAKRYFPARLPLGHAADEPRTPDDGVGAGKAAPGKSLKGLPGGWAPAHLIGQYYGILQCLAGALA
jgi:hypothetical protein